MNIAIAVNGTVRAAWATRSSWQPGGGELFGVMVPPSALKNGKNEVKVYEISGGRTAGD